MKVKFLQLKFIVFLLCFVSLEITGICEPVTNLHLPDTDIETEVELVRPVSYKLVKIPLNEKLEADKVSEAIPEVHPQIIDDIYSLVSYTTHNFSKSGAKLAQELSTVG